MCIENNKQTMHILEDYGWGDKVSSWWCGKSTMYRHCNDVSGSCEELNGMSGAGNIMNS